MKNRLKNNRGITLVELMVALAVLAMLMTAVIMMMSNNTVIYRKTKANINIQTTAQETYNSLQDSVMQAKQMILVGYEGEAKTNTSTYVKAADVASTTGFYNVESIEKLSEGGTLTEIHPTMLSIKYSIRNNYDEDEGNLNCTVNYYFVRYTDDNGDRKCNVYLTRQYDSGSGKTDDIWTGTEATNAGWSPAEYMNHPETDPTKDQMKFYEPYLFTSSLSEATFTVDDENQTVGMDLEFLDKGSTFRTNGYITIRNSYVLNERRDRTKPDASTGTPSVSVATPSSDH